MDDKTRKLLVSAWQENRLAALHVDAQWIFNDKVFEVIGTMAQGFRERSIENIWAAWPDYERRIPTGISTVGDYHRTDQGIDYYLSNHVDAKASETVLVKNAQSCFGMMAPHLDDYLDNKKIDTLIVTGVGGLACVEKTLRQGILMDKYNFVASLDAINKTDNNYGEHIKSVTQKNPVAYARRYHEATSSEILGALPHCFK
jgi:nicotinamidase-related amidase